MKKRQIEIYILGIVIILLVVFFLFINKKITYDRLSAFLPVEDSLRYVYEIEDAVKEDDYFVLSGFFFELKKIKNIENQVSDNKNLSVILYEITQNDELNFETENTLETYQGIPNEEFIDVKRDDVNNYFNCEFDYSKSGFIAKYKLEDLHIDDSCYRVLIKTDKNLESAIVTDTYIVNGKLMYVEPKSFVELDCNDTDLYNIVNYGDCLVNDKNNNIYIYQYERSLYWIADIDYKFNADNNTLIQFMMETTQFDRLPKERIENGWFFGNNEFVFEQHEITKNINCGKYRVAVMEIPHDYSVGQMTTGSYINETWIWVAGMRPKYGLKNGA